MLLRKKMFGSWLFLMVFTTMRAPSCGKINGGRQEDCARLDQEFGKTKKYFDKFEEEKTRVYDKHKASLQ
jgi:hypothetical protein